MSIWDAIGNGLEFGKTKDNNGKPLLATTFTANFGDTINTLMGGGRFTNLIGSDAKVVFDWEEFGVEPKGNLGKAFSAFMGLGGDALMVYGNKTAFHYSGIAFTSRRGEKPPINFSDTATMNLEAAAKRKGVFITVGVGIAAIVALSVTVRLKYSNFAINKDKPDLVKGEEKTEEEQAKEQAEEKNTELAKNLICGFFVICEDRWLLFLRHLDIGLQMEKVFGDNIIACKADLKIAEKNLRKQQMIVEAYGDGVDEQLSEMNKKSIELLQERRDAARAAYDKSLLANTSDLDCYLE